MLCPDIISLLRFRKKPVQIIVIKKKAHLYCFQRTFYANVKLCRKLPCSLKGMMIWLEICCKVFSPKTPIVDLDGLVFFLANLKGRPRHFIRVPFDSNFSTSRDANGAAVTPNPIAHLIKTQYSLSQCLSVNPHSKTGTPNNLQSDDLSQKC